MQLEGGHCECPSECVIGLTQQTRGDPGLHARKLAGLQAVGGDAVEFLVHGCQDRLGRRLRRMPGLECQQQRIPLVERVTESAEVGAHTDHRPVLLHEPTLQAARVTGGQDVGEHVVGQELRQVHRGVGHPVSDGEGGPGRQRIGQDRSPVLGAHRLGEARAHRYGTGGDVGEVALDQSQRVLHVDVTDNGEHGVTRRVVLVEEVLGVVQARGLELMEVPVAVVGVREGVERDRREGDPREATVGAVHDVHTNLFLNHRDLVVQVLPGDPGGTHPVGLEEQGTFQRPGRQKLVVVGVIRMGGPVEGAPGCLHVLRVLGLTDIFAALEHQMFEQVRETGASFRFGPETDVVVDGHGDNRSCAIRSQYNAQTIREGGLFNRVGGRRQRNGGRVRLGSRGHDWQRYCARTAHGPSPG